MWSPHDEFPGGWQWLHGSALDGWFPLRQYAKVKTGGTVSFGTETGDKQIALADVAKLAEVDETNVISIKVKANKISELVYDNGQKKCTYKPENSAKTTDGDYNVETSTKK